MIQLNPIPHAQSAWSKVDTIFGKIALILFYSLIWISITGSVISIFTPGSYGMQCFLNLYPQNAKMVVIALVRGIDVVTIGLLLYADMVGLKIKNVAMVFVILTLYAFVILPLTTVDECNTTKVDLFFCPTVAALALILVIADHKLTVRGTVEENTSLVV